MSQMIPSGEEHRCRDCVDGNGGVGDDEMAMMRMAHQNTVSKTDKRLEKPGAVFHDFLGMKPGDSSLVLSSKIVDFRLSDPSPSSASISVGAPSAGARGPLSTTSDVGSERQVENHLEGVPFYGPRSDISTAEIRNRLVGSKRSNSDSSFMGSSRDGFSQMPLDSFQNSHLMKMLRNATGREPHKRYNDDEAILSMQQLRSISTVPIVHPPIVSKLDASFSKWERSILMNGGPVTQQPSHGVPVVPFVHQVGSNKVRDANAGPSLMSQFAADEGSRTGMKGPGLLSSIKASTPASEKVPPGVLLTGSMQKSGTNITEAETSTPPSRNELPSASRQMTIFYGGQAHVFDDVHPNKADIIMGLAGSNGGSWSTTYSPKSIGKVVGDGNVISGENEIGVGNKRACLQEFQGRLPVTANSSHLISSSDRLGTQPGVPQGSNVSKDTKRPPFQAAEPSSEDKRGL